MCVIMVVNKDVRPSDEMISQAFAANKFGAGAAWRDAGMVHWKKGMKEDEIQDVNRILPFPYVLHFRVPSSGTSVIPNMCHPFPITRTVPLALEGKIKGMVLFHNGFWAGWKQEIKTAAFQGGYKIPTGAWSDTRGLAWIAAHVGNGILEFIDEKVIVFGPDTLENFGSGWTLERGVWVSNTHWMPKIHSTTPAITVQGYYGSVPGHHTAGERATGGPSTDATFCGLPHQTARPTQHGQAEPKEVPPTTETTALQTRSRSDQDALASFEWARGINKKERSHASQALPATFSGKCQACTTKDAVYFTNGNRYCWVCWEQLSKPIVVDAEKTIEARVVQSTCNACGIYQAFHRRNDDKQWICRQCWIKSGRPPVKGAVTQTASTPDDMQQVH